MASSAELGSSPPWPGVSVVMAVRDEERHLATAVRRVLAQDYPGDLELVLAVGPSKDRTSEVANEFARSDPRVRVVDNPRGITPAGLNAAIAASSYDVTLRVDGHAIVPPGYIRRAVTVLVETGADNVGGVMAAEGDTPFERAVALAMTSPLGIGGARFHTGGGPGPVDSVYLGTFRRAAIERVGGYDERFVRAQDWELNHRIRDTGGTVYFTPELVVAYRPRSSWSALARQFFRTGQWRRRVMAEHPESVRLRYLAPPVAVVGVVAGSVAAMAGWRPGLVAPGGYLVTVVIGGLVEGRGQPPGIVARLPGVVAVMHLAWGLGFLVGRARARA